MKREKISEMEKQKTILYVDDDADDQEMFNYAFNECSSGFELKTADNGIDALQKLASGEKPACIYIDINMPKMNGLQFLEILKSNHEYADIPAIIFSTTLDPLTVKEAGRLGAAEFFVKPTNFNALVDQLKWCMNTHIEARLEARAA
jgi:CheY-like chemotaxis protein